MGANKSSLETINRVKEELLRARTIRGPFMVRRGSPGRGGVFFTNPDDTVGIFTTITNMGLEPSPAKDTPPHNSYSYFITFTLEEWKTL